MMQWVDETQIIEMDRRTRRGKNNQASFTKKDTIPYYCRNNYATVAFQSNS